MTDDDDDDVSIEVKRRRGRRCKKLLDDLKDRRGYCQLKEEDLDRTMWRNRFGRGFGPVVWQITDDDDDDDDEDHQTQHIQLRGQNKYFGMASGIWKMRMEWEK